MKTSERILADLKRRVGFEQEIDFMNIYKGVPLVYTGYLQEVEDDAAIFRVEPPDSVCLTWDEHTYILDEHFISGIKAQVLDFDITSGEVKAALK